MRITPLDVRKHAFPKRFSGYASDEVDSFLGMVADDFEDLLRESEELREKVIRLEVRVADLAATHSRLAVCGLDGVPLEELSEDMAIAEGPDAVLQWVVECH